MESWFSTSSLAYTKCRCTSQLLRGCKLRVLSVCCKRLWIERPQGMTAKEFYFIDQLYIECII